MNGIYEEALLALHAVWRRRWLALGVAWGVALAGWLVIALIPNSYESQARVFVQMQQLLPSKLGIAPGERQRDIDRVRQTLSSAVSLEKVVRGTDLARQAQSDRDVADLVNRLRDDVTVKATQDNLFEITARIHMAGLSDSANAKLAKAVVQKLIDIFVEENLSGDRDENAQTLRFLDNELASRQAQLHAAEQKRVEFEQRYLGLLPGSGSLEQRMDAARTQLADIETNLSAAQSSLSALNAQLTGTPASVPGVGGAAAVGGARGRIAALEAQLADAAAKGWTDQHPDVVSIRQQIDRLRPQAAKEGTAGASIGTTPNPVYLSLRSMIAEKQSNVAALAARRAQLNADLASFQQKQAEAPELVAEQARLSRDYEVLKAQYDKLLTDREDVKLRSDVATKTDAVKFRVIDPPSDPRVPVAPNRPLLLAGVLVLALGLGVGGAFAKAQLDQTYATPDRLAAAAGLPVLGSITEVVTDARKALDRRRLRQFAGGAAALFACFLVLMLVEFVQRSLVA